MIKNIRKHIVEAAFHAKHGHMPSALSIVEIICALDQVMKEEDEFVLSKGHGCLAYYSYLVCKDVLKIEDVKAFGKKGSKLGGHPDRNKIDKVYVSTGSLGQGFPMAVGASLARKIQKKDGKFYCIVGDGECNEGSIWEALMVASNHKLDNIVCIIDNNYSQARSLPTTDLVAKFQSFGWNVHEVDGHSVEELVNALNNTSNLPTAIVANTVKGKGIAEIESNVYAWHHRAPNEDEYINFIREIDEKPIC